MSKIRKILFKFISELPVIGIILSDNDLRLRSSLYFGTLVNLLYVVLKVTFGILYRSLWLSFYGGYYLMLAILRVFIVERDIHSFGKTSNDIAEYKRFRACGIILLLLNIMLVFITKMAANFKAEIDFPGFLILGMALYSFYAVISASIGAYKYRNHNSLMFTAAKIASLTAALVSMLVLEIAMTARFGAEDIDFRRNMTIITGTGVFAIILIMALMMIIRANRLIKTSS